MVQVSENKESYIATEKDIGKNCSFNGKMSIPYFIPNEKTVYGKLEKMVGTRYVREGDEEKYISCFVLE